MKPHHLMLIALAGVVLLFLWLRSRTTAAPGGGGASSGLFSGGRGGATSPTNGTIGNQSNVTPAGSSPTTNTSEPRSYNDQLFAKDPVSYCKAFGWTGTATDKCNFDGSVISGRAPTNGAASWGTGPGSSVPSSGAAAAAASAGAATNNASKLAAMNEYIAHNPGAVPDWSDPIWAPYLGYQYLFEQAAA